MVRPVPETLGLPGPPRSSDIAVTTWAGNMIRVLSGIFAEGNIRLNRVLPKDGTERMTAALPLLSVTVATLPTASENTGNIIFVSDGGAGAVFRGSDGTTWVSLG